MRTPPGIDRSYHSGRRTPGLEVYVRHFSRYGAATESASNKDMEWWQQVEALVAFLNAYQLTGDPKYWQAFDHEARFVMERFVDHQYGEVYTAIFQNGRIDVEKVGPWKAPYQVTRACLEIISRLSGTL